MNKRAQFVEVAEFHLGLLLSKNDYQSLDLSYDMENLIKSDWEIKYDVKNEFYSVLINILRMMIIKNDDVIATYTIYLNMNLEFMDEFFISRYF